MKNETVLMTVPRLLTVRARDRLPLLAPAFSSVLDVSTLALAFLEFPSFFLGQLGLLLVCHVSPQAQHCTTYSGCASARPLVAVTGFCTSGTSKTTINTVAYADDLAALFNKINTLQT